MSIRRLTGGKLSVNILSRQEFPIFLGFLDTDAWLWLKMNRVFDALWSDWKGEFEPAGSQPGEDALMVRVKSKSGKVVYDTVSIFISDEPSMGDYERGEIR